MFSHGLVFLCVAVAGGYGWWYGSDKVTNIQLIDKNKQACMWFFCFVNPGQTYTLRFTWTVPKDLNDQGFSARLGNIDIIYEDSICYTPHNKSVRVDVAEVGCEGTCVIPKGKYTINVPLAIPKFKGISYLFFNINDDVGIYSVVSVKG